MKFKKQFNAILQKLGLVDKVKENSLTDEDWKNISASYMETYGTEMTADMAEAETLRQAQQERDRIRAIMSSDDGDDPDESKKPESKTPFVETDLTKTITDMVKTTKEMKEKLDAMSKMATPDVPQSVTTVGVAIPMGEATTADYLFGIQNSLFSMKKRWNQIANNPAVSSLSDPEEDTDGIAFRKEAATYGKLLKNRFGVLKNNKMLDPVKLASGEFSLGTSSLSDAGLGDQYMIRRQDALIARILTLRSVTDLFPIRYGVQDREMITNAFFTETSQAYQSGKIWKGSMSLEPEFGYVDDAMVKVYFGPMKEIERKYIGYLNTDGSDPIKWSMIEFALLNIFTKMQNEQNKRRVMGIYLKPETGVAGHYLNAGTGIVYTLIRLQHEHKLLPHDDVAYASYTSSDMLATVQEFVSDVMESLPEDQELEGNFIYLNSKHKPWWLANIRTTYGKDTDFTGPDSYANVIPDTEIRIKWLPNLGNMKLMFIQTPGNLQFLEFIPGEMLNVRLYNDMEEVYGFSYWKEGCSPAFAGRKFTSLEALKTNAYQYQEIFLNKPATTLAADATTANADNGIWFTTSGNTAAKAITDITKAKKGIVYIIECGSTTNATTIAKADKFSSLTEAWTPVAVGDYIMVTLDSTSKFVDLERCVNGVRSINTTLQPNVPGAR